MKWISRLLTLLFILLLISVAGLIYALNSEKVLNRALQTYISQSGEDIKYDSIKGGLFGGLSIKGFDYHGGDVRGDAKLVVDFNALKDGIVKVDDINISNLHISKKFLDELLSTPSSKEKKSSTNNPIKEIILKKAHLDLKDISYKEYNVESLNLDVKDFRSDLKSFWGVVEAEVKSSVADGSIDAKLSGKSYDADIDLVLRANYLQTFVSEQNITIQIPPRIKSRVVGDFEKVLAEGEIVGGKIIKEDIWIKNKTLPYRVAYNFSTNDIDANFSTHLKSSLADVDGDIRALVDLDEVNQTLLYKVDAAIKPSRSYLASQLKDINITLKKLSPLHLVLNGDAKQLDSRLNLNGTATIDGVDFSPTIKDTKFHLDLVSKEFSTKLYGDLKSGVGDADIVIDAKGDLDDINNSLSYDAKLTASHLKEFKGVDPSEFGDIKLIAKGSLKNLTANVNSNLLEAKVDSDDFKRFDFSVSTKDIYLGKIYKKIDKTLQKSYISLDGKGSYEIGTNSLELDGKLDKFYYNNRLFSSNRFKLSMDKNSFTISPLKISGGDFYLNIDAKMEGEYIVAKLNNQAINLKAKFRQEPLYLDARGRVGSIKSLLKEVDKFYKIETDELNIDGPLNFRAKMEGERIKADISSPALKVEDGRLERLNIVALYEPKRVVLKRFRFDMRGFGDKSMSKEVRLARDGIITFDGEDATADIELKNLAHFKGVKKGDRIDASLDANHLVLALKGYGKTTITSNLKLRKRGEKSYIDGELEFRETEVNYKSRYLDISKDSDIIIISKKKKRKDSSFRENIQMNLHITSADNILYKVDDGEVEFRPDIRVKKAFGAMPVITGKIKVEDGFYDLADKRFKIKEGAVAFRGQKEPNPLLDLHVEYDELDEIDIFIDIRGDKNRPRLNFSSKPLKSKKDIFSYLLFGMSASESEGAMSSANKAAERIFGRAVSKDLARELHLDRLDMNRNSDGGIDVKAGKKRDKKTIIYYQNKSTKSSVIVEHKLTKDWEIDTEVGQDGHGIDFVYKRGFK